ncbi:MAG: hypothetical protein KBD01_20230, partial [Acidobacteria bacterium]|nr:hypothetical protein [Acidobacteriota bacterium]
DGELEVLARVVGETPPELVRAGLAVRMSRAAAEALGLRWGEHFGLEEQDPERIWLRVPAAGGPAPYVDVRVEACASADVG